MKTGYDVFWSEIAETDLLVIIEYIANDSASRAYDIFRDIRKKASGLRLFPERGRIVPEFLEQGITLYHELIVGPWRVIHRVAEKHVYVLSVLDSRRSVEDILLRRLVDLKL